jgi:hypothetical protein
MKAWVGFLAALEASTFLSCAAGNGSGLCSRGLSRGEREAYLAEHGYDGLGRDIRDAFLEGRPAKGMPRELVFRLYGIPDRNSDTGEGWEYLDREKRLVTGVHFKEEEVDSIYGDPLGGSAPGGSRR